MRSWTSCLALTALLALGAGEAAAQVPGIQLKVNPRIGLYAPLSDLGETQTIEGTVSTEQSGGLAIGLGIELDMIALPVNIRANLDYATAREVSTAGGITGAQTAESTLLALVADLMFRPLPRIVVAQPYLFAGAGLKMYDVSGETTAVQFESESDPTLHLGGGLEVGFGPLALNLELGDYISWYELQEDSSEVQHDLFVTLGFLVNIL